MDEIARVESTQRLLLLAVPWILASVLVGYAAARRGQSGFGAFLVSVFFSPIFGILYAGVLPDRSREREAAEAAAEADAEQLRARRENRLCDSCGFISNHPFRGKCPECGVPRGAAAAEG